MRLKALNGCEVDAMDEAVPRLLDAGFTPVSEDKTPDEKPKATTTRKPKRAVRK